MPSRHLRTTVLAGATLAALMAIGGSVPALAEPATAGPAPATAGTARTALTTTERATQHLAWTPCVDRATDPGLPEDYYRMRCATLRAPLNWNDPYDQRQVQIAVTKLPATVQPARGVLFTNPGGPGAGGADLPLMFVSARRNALLRTQDIYGIDVRGSGGSTNITCGGTSGDLLDPRDRTAANTDLLLDSAQLLARSCGSAGGDVLRNVTTEQTVADLDLLRSLVGASKINWLGYSAGTWLGAQYATAHPDRVGHFVLDSNVDFTETWQRAADNQPQSFERRYRDDFLPWAAKYDDEFGLGRTPEAVNATFEQVRSQMSPEKPVPSAVTLDQLVTQSLYDGSLFPVAAGVIGELKDFIAAQQRGNVRAMSTARARVRTLRIALPQPTGGVGRRPMSSDTETAAYLAITCNDTRWDGNRSSALSTSDRLGREFPLVGWSMISEPCLFWDRPPVNLPRPTGAGLPPVLMVQSDRDPATSAEGARHAAANFPAARLLRVRDNGDHGQYGGSNGCVNKAVEQFLIDGAVPADLTCPGRKLPAPDVGLYAAGLSTAGVRAAGLRAGVRAAGDQVVEGQTSGLPTPASNPLLALERITALLDR